MPDGAKQGRGASGLSAERVLRCAILENRHGLRYSKLACCLSDSCPCQAFCRIPFPSKACLQENISRIKPETRQKVNRALAHGRPGEAGGAQGAGDFHGRGQPPARLRVL